MWLYGKDGAMLRVGDKVTTLAGQTGELRHWREPSDTYPMGQVEIKFDLVSVPTHLYPTAINASFRGR